MLTQDNIRFFIVLNICIYFFYGICDGFILIRRFFDGGLCGQGHRGLEEFTLYVWELGREGRALL